MSSAGQAPQRLCMKDESHPEQQRHQQQNLCASEVTCQESVAGAKYISRKKDDCGGPTPNNLFIVSHSILSFNIILGTKINVL
jgi:hypothetical protein